VSTRIGLGLILAASAAVRIAFVGDPPVRYDEVFTWQQYATNSVHHIVTDYKYPNNHILNSLAEHFGWRIFGESEAVMRLPALIFGIALVVVVYVVALMLYDRAAALWAAALAGGSSLLIQYSINGRGYSMGMVFVFVAVGAAALVARRPGPWPWIVLGASSVLAVYTVPTMAGGVAIAFAWAFLRRRPPWKPLLITGAAAAVAGGLLYLPGRGDQSWNPPSDWVVHGISAKTRVVDEIWEQWNDALPWPLQLVLAVGFVTALIAHRRMSSDPFPLGAVAIVVTAVIFFVLPQSPLPRTYYYLLPFYLVTAGAGLAFLVRLVAERISPRLPAEAATAGIAAVVALALTLSFTLRGDDRYSIDPPRSEKDIASIIRPDRPLMSTVTTADPLSFYLGGYTKGRPEWHVSMLNGHPRQVAVAVATGYGESLPDVLETTDLHKRPGTHSGLVRNGRWIDVYEVGVEP
jgi:MFS family permease